MYNVSAYATGFASVCLSVLFCSVMLVYCGQTTERIELPFGMRVTPKHGHIILDGGPDPPKDGGVIGQIGDFGYLILVIGKSCSRPSAPVGLDGSSSASHRRQVWTRVTSCYNCVHIPRKIGELWGK
jgi:hypothetical protein